MVAPGRVKISTPVSVTLRGGGDHSRETSESLGGPAVYLHHGFLELGTLLSVLGYCRPVTRIEMGSISCRFLTQCPPPCYVYSLSPVVEGRNASVDHGLNSKALADLHLSRHLRVSVVNNAWVVGMELSGTSSYEQLATDLAQLSTTHELVDTMTDILSHDTETLGFDDRLDLVTNLSVKSTWLD
jgi:hypothetical protein